MPVWFLVLLLALVLVAVLLAIGMAFSRRSAGGQSTTIVDTTPSSESKHVTVVEHD